MMFVLYKHERVYLYALLTLIRITMLRITTTKDIVKAVAATAVLVAATATGTQALDSKLRRERGSGIYGTAASTVKGGAKKASAVVARRLEDIAGVFNKLASEPPAEVKEAKQEAPVAPVAPPLEA